MMQIKVFELSKANRLKLEKGYHNGINCTMQLPKQKGIVHKDIITKFILPLLSTPVFSQNIDTPNIVLIMCDDMGFSDIGCYGSEIKTPNIDKLAQEGVRFSQFKNTGRSCPSRAALLTGRYQHQAGMGWMAEVDEHRPGYRG